MRKIVLILVIGVMAAGCMQEYGGDMDIVAEAADEGIRQTDTGVVPLEDALVEMRNLMGHLYGGATRSFSVDIRDVQTLKGDQIRRATRSSAASLPEDVFYLVNFGDDNGYAILGADSRLPSVIAIVERGSISPEDFILPAYTSATRSGEDGILSLDDLWVEEDQDYYLSGSNPDWMLNKILHYPERELGEGGPGPSPPPPSSEYTPWTDTLAYTDALMTTKWSQYSPFNDKCPRGRHYKDNYPAGCVAVAVAQILAHNGTPTAASLFGVTSTWEEFTDYNFSASLESLIRPPTARDTLIRDEIATVLKKIGDGVGMNYGFFGYNSFSTPNKAKKYLRDKAGYRNVTKYNSYREGKIVSCLRRGTPVFMGAIDNFVDGHAWVIDGYLEQTRQLVRRTEGSNEQQVVKEETRKLMHCNFGWGGSADGYYISKVFHTERGPVEVAPVDSHEIGDPTGQVWDSDWWWRTVVYEL